MNPSRLWPLLLTFVALVGAYVYFFTDWLSPAPIEIASQVRPSILQPRFGRSTVKVKRTNTVPETGEVVVVRTNVPKTNHLTSVDLGRRARLPDWGEIDQAPGGSANVTFSLDASYVLTALRVEDVPSDGSAPRVLWQLAGKSAPTRSLLYGRDPSGMVPTRPGVKPEPLTPGAPYRLVIEAGRRRGTNSFTTLRAAPVE